ncbi:phytanoyl-CoA dioxygenase [bacterium 336/3]|nr:phytanoyl-CoA dioxygenase [bacterium 336/3]
MKKLKSQLENEGFCIVEGIYTEQEIKNIIDIIDQTESNNTTFRKSKDLFAIRQFHKEVPETLPHIFNDSLKNILLNWFDEGYFITKSIYFDKPADSNWFVAYHQDLTISVNQKVDLPDYQGWIQKQNQYSVQPPVNILENNFTIRIHLDDTTSENGALKVIPLSHQKGILRPENFNFKSEKETVCTVKSGGVMFMKPLILHASNKTTNQARRRVIHIEFSNQILPTPLEWSEKHPIF